MGMFRRAAVAVLVGSLLGGSVMTAAASDRMIFAGCVMARTDTTVTLSTSGGEEIVIDTTWLKAGMLDTLTSECMTVSALTVDGRYVAESVEEGIDP
jgi:hypothetical protein